MVPLFTAIFKVKRYKILLFFLPCRFFHNGMSQHNLRKNDVEQEGPVQPGGRLAGAGERSRALHSPPGGYGRRWGSGQCVVDPGCRIPDPDPHQRILSIFNPKKLFFSSRKNDLGCSSRMWN